MPKRDDWHAIEGERALEVLGAARSGLLSEDAKSRLATYGPNALPQAPPRQPLVRFLSQFNNALIYFLLFAAVGAAILGHGIDAAVIAAVILINAFVGFVQEGKAEQALEAMRKMISPRANVLRDSMRKSVAVEDLVPADIVLLEAGDRVPADLRILRARGVRIDEALLTGESVPAEKKESPAPKEADLGARHSMAYSGTLVVAGQATGLVVATGSESEIGRISAMLESVEPLTTPLLRQINRFGRQATVVIFVGAMLLFVHAVFVHHYDWVQALIAVVALAVAAIPEGLPAVITITLAIGVQRMAARNAVIRRLPAVETLGATSVICSDKTGTLTRNEMTAVRVVTRNHHARAGGSGYAPHGTIEAVGHDDDAACLAAVMPVIRCGLLCNDAHLREHGGAWQVEGDPMEGALVALAMKSGLRPEHVRAEWPRLDEIPFDASYRYMASLHRSPGDDTAIFIKGAPEAVLEMCETAHRDYWRMRIVEAAAAGERVLGFAMRRTVADTPRITAEALAAGNEFLGIVGFIDPPREEAVAAIAQCRSAGVTVKMITGDHVATATAIATNLGLTENPIAVTGAELDRLEDVAFADRVHESAVFARTSPEHKLRIVRALQARGAVVAMTGDGVNDAPALKQANVGVAMGIKGTEASKEAAEMVLLDDNFASIVNAVHEGRTVYDNIRKVIAWTLPTNGGEVIIIMVALLFGLTLPMTAAQILWVNLVTAVTLGLALAFEPSEPGVMTRPPRPANTPLLSRFLLWRVLLVSLLFFAACQGIFQYALQRGEDLETARTMVVNALVVLEAFYLFNVRYLHMTSITWGGALGTPAVLYAIGALVAAQLLFTYAPFMHDWFQTRPLGIADGALIIATGVALLFLLEGEKALMRRLGHVDLR
ncbi:MAG: cation-transporting P-type ATPase [Betaproteobacteria bacterium]